MRLGNSAMRRFGSAVMRQLRDVTSPWMPCPSSGSPVNANGLHLAPGSSRARLNPMPYSQ
jgi:hypothetical protein